MPATCLFQVVVDVAVVVVVAIIDVAVVVVVVVLFVCAFSHVEIIDTNFEFARPPPCCIRHLGEFHTHNKKTYKGEAQLGKSMEK